MAIQVQKWSPDTCSCVFIEQYDDADPPDSRVVTPLDSFVSPIDGVVHTAQKCPAHSAIADKIGHNLSVHSENALKNNFLQHVLDNFPALTRLADNGTTPILKDGALSFSFDQNRVLTVSLPSLGSGAKTALRAALVAKFGAGKITVT